jgi:hypothetical protein
MTIALALVVGLKVLSGRPDMVSGGDALVEITGVPQGVTVVAANRDVTASFRPAPKSETLVGRIEGLPPGKSSVLVRQGKRELARLDLTTYPISGPIFSGPHQTPFACVPEIVQMGPPRDQDCSLPTKVSYFYYSNLPPTKDGPVTAPFPTTHFRPYDPSAPRPPDLVQTTTTDGKTVDFIVRREVGTINRGIYSIAFLHQPGEPLPDPWTRIPGWNGRLVFSFQGGCEPGYRQGHVPPPLTEAVLAQGFAEAGSTLSTFGNNANDVLSAETMMMVKEHFIKRYGLPVHTIGNGGSGGTMQQFLIAQNYPGLLNALSTDIGYPDTFSVLPGAVACSLLANVFDHSAQPWTHEQKGAVSGYSKWEVCESWFKSGYSPGWVQANRCRAVPTNLVYDPVQNPTGVRCDMYGNQITLWGRDPETGHARRALDNVGVQYGVLAFNAGKITAEQFLELNEKIGGFDLDGNIVPRRMRATPETLRIAYATGRVNMGAGSLGSIPIVDIRGYRDAIGNFHDKFRTYQAQARITAVNGDARNMAIFVQPPRDFAPLVLLDRWLDAIDRDHVPGSPAEKVRRNRPAETADACWVSGEKVVEPATYKGAGRCNDSFPAHGDPIMAAGGPLTGTILKCALKPVTTADSEQPLTLEQLERLKRIFPDGVCDYSLPGTEERSPRETWQVFSAR